MNALERLRFALEAQGRRHPLLRTVLLLVLLIAYAIALIGIRRTLVRHV